MIVSTRSSVSIPPLIFTKIEEKLKLLLTGRKIENRPTKQGLDLFFVLEDSLHTGIKIIERSVEEQHPTNNISEIFDF